MNTKLIIHIVISLISLSGLIVYYYAFLLGYKKHNSQLKKQSKLPEKLYFMSNLSSTHMVCITLYRATKDAWNI